MEEKKRTNKGSYSRMGKCLRGFFCILTFCVLCVSAILSIYAEEIYGVEIILNPKKQYKETVSFQEEVIGEISRVLNCCELVKLSEKSKEEISIMDVLNNEIHYYNEVGIDKDVYNGKFTAKTLKDLGVYEHKETSKYTSKDLMDYEQMKAYLEESEPLCDYLYFDTNSFRALFERDGLQNTNHRFSDEFSEEAYFVFENYDKEMENTSQNQSEGSMETVVREIVITPQNMDFYAVYDPEDGIYYSTYDDYFNEMNTYIYSTDTLLNYIVNSKENEETDYSSLIIPLLRSYNYSMEELVQECSGIYETIERAKYVLSQCANKGIHYHLQEEKDSFLSNVKNMQEIESMEIYYCFKKTDEGVVTQFHGDTVPDLENLDVVNEYLASYPVGTSFHLGFDSYTGLLWNEEASPVVRGNEEYRFFRDCSIGLLIAVVVSFVLLLIQAISLICTTGRHFKGDKEIALNIFDRFFSEIWFAISAGMLIVSVVFAIVCLDQISINKAIGNIVFWTITGSLVFGFCFMLLVLSFVRRIKAHNLWDRLLLVLFVKGMIRKMREKENADDIDEEQSQRSQKSAVEKKIIEMWRHCKERICAIKGTEKLALLFVILMILEFIVIVMGYDNTYPEVFIFIFLILQLILLLVVMWVIMDIDKLVEGVKEINKGNLNGKVEINEKISVFGELAHGINHIGDGLKNAVETSLKDERMKTELITNVSHDLKTPLTSIINYIDLLKKEEISGEDAKHYIEVLDTKSQRLKQLTEDLVEAAKATSGNIELEMMPITFDELMKQALGEFEDKYESKHLTIVAGYPKEPAVVLADGRRLFRIIENVLQNIYKYAMEGTRVYADLSKEDGVVKFTLKNVSAAPLNISPEELMERFTRGDSSRTTEGSGLGLSIAKDLTRLQNGEFEIQLDGDLFKVVIQFPEYGKTDA